MKRGFTLIELLAVIIILAIVAIIATPIVLNVVNDAKESAAKSTTYNIIDGAKMYYAESMFDNSKKAKLTGAANIYDDILFNGKKPENGQLYVNKKGLVAVAIVINNKCYKKEFAGELQITEDNECNVGVTADNISPTVLLSVVETSFNDNGWANKDFYVNIKVIDNETGGYSYMWCSGIDDCEPIALRENSSGKVLVSTESETSVVCIIGYDLAGNDSEKTCSEPYKLDKQKPVLTVTSEEIEIEEGANTLVSSYFNVSYGISGGTLTCNPTNTSTLNFENRTVSCTATSGSGISTTENKTITIKLPYTDNSGANQPILFTGMKPVVWNETEFVEVNKSEKWYDYDAKEWANARTVDGSYWVWIPRYAYKITSGYHTNTAGTIDIKFLTGTTDTTKDGTTIETSGYISGVKDTSMHYFSHPAFKFDESKTGFWVAKYEPSGTSSSINIVPNASSLRKMNINSMFNASLNMKSNSKYGWNVNQIDTHMMTNMEWGAVAYLSKSKYGANAEVWINNSNTYITGCAGNSVSESGYSGCQNAYNTTNGVKASTTHNIYGVYDMSGGTYEMMSAYVGNGYGAGSTVVDAASKYKTVYNLGAANSAPSNYAANSHMYGDAVYETSSSGSDGSKLAWYQDGSVMPYTSQGPYFGRGGAFGNGSIAGLFYFERMNSGGPYDNYSFRVVVFAK